MRTGTQDRRKFNRRFILQQPKGIEDAGGHIDLTDDDNWQNLGEYWLKLFGQSSKEFYRAMQVQGDVTHVAEVPYSKVTANLNPSYRWFDGQRKLQITAAFDPDDNREVIQMRLVQQV